MPFDRPHFYLTFGGTLFPAAAGNEEWQSGLHFAAGPTAQVEQYEEALQAISTVDILEDVTDLIASRSQALVKWGSTVTAAWCKLAIIGTNGKYAGAPKLSEQAPVTGVFGPTPIATQLAACVSLWSGDTFGRGNRGRSYLPLPVTAYNSVTYVEPRIHAGQATAIRDAFKLFLTAVEGEVSTGPLSTDAVIMSSLGLGVTKPILRISCGRVIDTMRSRRQALDEEKVWTTFP